MRSGISEKNGVRAAGRRLVGRMVARRHHPVSAPVNPLDQHRNSLVQITAHQLQAAVFAAGHAKTLLLQPARHLRHRSPGAGGLLITGPHFLGNPQLRGGIQFRIAQQAVPVQQRHHRRRTAGMFRRLLVSPDPQRNVPGTGFHLIIVGGGHRAGGRINRGRSGSKRGQA